jgi:hypothetical protein
MSHPKIDIAEQEILSAIDLRMHVAVASTILGMQG